MSTRPLQDRLILFVDDEPMIRSVFERRMVREGFAVELAGTGEEAVAIAGDATFPIVVCDLTLGEWNGFDVVRQVHAISPASRFILVSGALVELPEDLQEMDCVDGTVLKPWDHAELTVMVESALEAFRAARDGEKDPGGDPALRHVLLLEESEEDALALTADLEETGVDPDAVVHVTSLEEALLVIPSLTPDLVLVGLTPPEERMRALDGVRRLQRTIPGTPIVVLTREDDLDVALRSLRAGAQEYVVKGQHDPASLARSIQASIERTRVESGSPRTDPDTGLPNRLAVQQRVKKAMAAAHRRTSTFGVIHLRIRCTVEGGPRIGEPGGEDLLDAALGRLLSVVRGSDTVGRVGPADFLVLVEDLVTPAEGRRAAERFVDALHRPLDVEGERLWIRCHLGIVVHDPAIRTAEAMLGRARDAVEEACARDVSIVDAEGGRATAPRPRIV